MSRRQLSKTLLAITVIAGCDANVDGWTKDDPTPDDVEDALAQFPEAQVIEWTADGLPMYIVGEMVKVGEMQSDDAIESDTLLRPAITPVLAAFRLQNDDIALRKMNVDADGNRHFRYTQTFNGLPVIGGDLVVHVDVKGAVFSVNGTARGDISPDLGSAPISEAVASSKISADTRYAGMTQTATRTVYVATAEGTTHKAYDTIVEGMRGADPVRDKVYVDVDSGEIVAVHPTIHFALNRRVHSANSGTSLTGTPRRRDGQAP